MRKTPCNFVDISGQQYGHWAVLERAESRYHKVYYRCRCRCGYVGVVGKQQLITGKSTNCGCHRGPLKRGPNYAKRWTKQEDDLIRQWYHVNGARPIARILERSVQSVRGRAAKIGVRVDKPVYPRNDKWSEGEIQKLKDNYPTGGLPACRELLRFRTDSAIKYKVAELGLHKIEKGKKNVRQERKAA